MSKPLYRLEPRDKGRRERSVVKAAIEKFMANGKTYPDMDPIIVAEIVNHCVEKGIRIKLDFEKKEREVWLHVERA